MAETLSLVAQSRDTEMTPRALRREGIVPGILYGNQYASVSLQFAEPALRRMLNTVGTTRLFSLTVPDANMRETVLVRDVQRDPVSGSLVHVDLYRVVADQPITTAVPLLIHGEAPVVEEGGVVNTLLNELEISCLPGDLPEHIIVDISVLTDMDSAIYVSDLAIPEGVTILVEADTAVARVVAPRALTEEELEAEALEAGELEGEEMADEETSEEFSEQESE